MRVVADDLSGEAVRALLRHHIEEAHRNSPPGLAFVFDADRLREPDVTFWTAWDGTPSPSGEGRGETARFSAGPGGGDVRRGGNVPAPGPPAASLRPSPEGKSVLLGCAALKQLDAEHGEVKSMRTAPAHVRKGVAAALLDHLIGEARARGYRRVSLETGSGPAYEPALALYRARGFVPGAAFGGYTPSDFNQFFHLDL